MRPRVFAYAAENVGLRCGFACAPDEASGEVAATTTLAHDLARRRARSAAYRHLLAHDLLSDVEHIGKGRTPARPRWRECTRERINLSGVDPGIDVVAGDDASEEVDDRARGFQTVPNADRESHARITPETGA